MALEVTYECLYDREEALARVQEALADDIYRAEQERMEMERVREELHLEEQEEAARQKEKAEIGESNQLNSADLLVP